MGLKFFGGSAAQTIILGAAVLALKDNEATTPEQVDAANQELEAAGITGAQLVPGATLEDLTAKAGRVDAAEAAEKEATEKVTDLEGKLATANQQLEELRKAPGASHTNPALPQGKSDIEGNGPDENQQAIDALPHNVALDNNPLFAKRID